MKKERFTVYNIITALENENILTYDFEWKKEKGGKVKVTDNSKYQVIFELQNKIMTTSTYNINDTQEHLARHSHYNNYVALFTDDDSSVIQLWGKVNRGEKGEVIIEFRKHLYEKLECDKLALFRDCKHEEYKHVIQNRLCVVDNEKDAVKIIKTFLTRLENKRRGKEKTDATEKENSNAIAQ